MQEAWSKPENLLDVHSRFGNPEMNPQITPPIGVTRFTAGHRNRNCIGFQLTTQKKTKQLDHSSQQFSTYLKDGTSTANNHHISPVCHALAHLLSHDSLLLPELWAFGAVCALPRSLGRCRAWYVFSGLNLGDPDFWSRDLHKLVKSNELNFHFYGALSCGVEYVIVQTTNFDQMWIHMYYRWGDCFWGANFRFRTPRRDPMPPAIEDLTRWRVGSTTVFTNPQLTLWWQTPTI